MQGSFVRKRGKSWTAYFYLADAQGNRRQRSKGGFRTKVEAQTFLSTQTVAVQRGEYVESNRLTLAQYLLERWLPTVEMTVRPTTFNSYKKQLELHVIPELGGVPLQGLSASHLDLLYSKLLKSGCLREPGGLAPKTVRYIHTTLHKALKDAERKQLVMRNVADAADPPRSRTSGSAEMKTWTVEELRVFLNAISDHRIGAAYVLAATTGMRRGEVLGLRWVDIDVPNNRLGVRQTVLQVNYKIIYGTPKTARGRRSISIDPATMAALQEHRRKQTEERKIVGVGYMDNGLAFAKVDGSPIHPDYFSQVFDRTVAKLPVPRIRLHDLRHTHATLGLAAHVPAKVMSDRLGHATVAFTQDVYMHAIPGLERDAANQIAELIFGSDVKMEADARPD
jgi:integrase